MRPNPAARLRAVAPLLSVPPAPLWAAPAGLPEPGTHDAAAVSEAKAAATAAFKGKISGDARAAGEREYAAGGGADALDTVAVSALQLEQTSLAFACCEAIAADPHASSPIAARAPSQIAAPKAQTGGVELATTGGSAGVFVEGVPIGDTRITRTLRFLPGRHEIGVCFEGAEMQCRTLQVSAGQTLTASFEAPPGPPPPVVVAASVIDTAPVAVAPPAVALSSAKPRLVRLAQNRVEFDEWLHFDTSDATVLSTRRPVLDDVAALFAEHTEIRHLRIEGHTDTRGDAEDNLWSSRARAFSVMRGLVERGVARERQRAAGYGETRLLVPVGTPDAEARNRRVELAVAELGPPPPVPVVPLEPGPAPVVFVPPIKPPSHRAATVPLGVQNLPDGVTPGLEAGLTADDLRRVAVLPSDALDEESESHELGRMTAELLDARLETRPWSLQVERCRLDAVAGELKRGERGELQPASTARARHLLGADSALIGSLAAVGPDFLVTAGAVDTETGQVVAAFDQAVERAGMVAFSEDAIETRTPLGSAWRAAAAPGCGQIYNDEPLTGIAVVSAFGAAAVTTGVSRYQGEQARDNYFASRARAQATVDRRNEGNTHIERARWTALGTGIIWAIDVADAYLNGRDARTIRPGLSDDGTQTVEVQR